MSFKSWRKQKLLSQERIAEMSGLSLRTVQRLDAGHRVSYASLRSLAATYEIDVDLLEREFYAADKSADEFVEIPRWVRILEGTQFFGSPRPNRPNVHLIETIVIATSVIFFGASLLTTPDGLTKIFRVGAIIELIIAYLVSRYIRFSDEYKLWPGTEDAQPQIHQTWKGRVAQYAYAFGVGILGIVMICWFVV
jgi:transcriptional regulator with XRE-family HTH domain